MGTSDRKTTRFDAETPRRDAVRTMGAAGAALLGVLGLSAASEAKGNRAKGEKKKKKSKVGPTGPTGPTGPAGGGAGATGPTGPTGPSGSFSLAGLTVEEREGTEFDVAASDIEVGTATCQAGELLIGGGFATNVSLGECFPTTLDIIGTEWAVEITCPAGTSATDVFAIAFCLKLA